jgi:hypothetical protein
MSILGSLLGLNRPASPPPPPQEQPAQTSNDQGSGSAATGSGQQGGTGETPSTTAPPPDSTTPAQQVAPVRSAAAPAAAPAARTGGDGATTAAPVTPPASRNAKMREPSGFDATERLDAAFEPDADESRARRYAEAERDRVIAQSAQDRLMELPVPIEKIPVVFREARPADAGAETAGTYDRTA